jgi:hypothetical protein
VDEFLSIIDARCTRTCLADARHAVRSTLRRCLASLEGRSAQLGEGKRLEAVVSHDGAARMRIDKPPHGKASTTAGGEKPPRHRKWIYCCGPDKLRSRSARNTLL